VLFKAEQQQHTRANRAWDCWLSSHVSMFWTWICCIHGEFLPRAEKAHHGLVGLCCLYKAEAWLTQYVSCGVSLLTAGRARLQGSSECLHKLKNLTSKSAQSCCMGFLGTWWCFWWWFMWIRNWLGGLSYIMGLRGSCEQSTADATRTKHWWDVESGPGEMGYICWWSCFVGLLNNQISFWLQLMWGDMSFWEKSCLSPEWQHLCGCKTAKFLPKELLTAHPSWGSDHVWCKMSVFFHLTLITNWNRI